MRRAEYGQYSRTCAETCCVPHPQDCFEVTQETNEGAWLELKVTCDNRTDCSYIFQGSTFLEGCAPGSYSDYMNIYYSCMPGKRLHEHLLQLHDR